MQEVKSSLKIAAVFAAGVGTGVLHLLPDGLVNAKPEPFFYVLCVFLPLVGIAIGGDAKHWAEVRRSSIRVFFVPVGIIIGTLLGSALAWSVTSGYTLREVLAVGSGLGYYTLSCSIIKEAGYESLSIVALFSNVFREIITMLLTPFMARYLYKMAPIAAGAATTMDTALPVITRFCGKEWATMAVINGIILSLLVPWLIGAIL